MEYFSAFIYNILRFSVKNFPQCTIDSKIQGLESIVDEKRPGRCVVSTTDPAIAAVASLIWSDRSVSINVQINLDNMLKIKH